jgi:hypothetical protein
VLPVRLIDEYETHAWSNVGAKLYVDSSNHHGKRCIVPLRIKVPHAGDFQIRIRYVFADDQCPIPRCARCKDQDRLEDLQDYVVRFWETDEQT